MFGPIVMLSSVWQVPYRPLFLLCGLWAVIVPTVWLWPWHPGDRVFWHMHELTLGMGGAAFGGYLLTALPSWTGQVRVSPRHVKWLVALWLAARVSILLDDLLWIQISIAVAASYFLMLFVVLLRPVLAARNLRKLPVVAAPVMLAAADAVMLWQRQSGWVLPQTPIVPVLVFAWQIALIGGRAVPTFAQSWLNRNGRPDRVYAPALLNWLGIGGVGAGLSLIVAGQSSYGGAALILTGSLQIGRIVGWRPRQVLGETPLYMLYVAWLWHGVGLLLVGLVIAGNSSLPFGAALHAMTMGAMGTMIIAIAGRGTMRPTPQGLASPPILRMGFDLVCVAALLRVISPLLTDHVDPIRISAAFWIVGWCCFLIALLPNLSGPISHPVLSAKRPAGQKTDKTQADVVDMPSARVPDLAQPQAERGAA